MENLIFSLNATVPVFMMMVLGMIFRKLNIINEQFASYMNKFVFLVALPVMLFKDLATVDIREVMDVKFVLFCFVVTIISIVIAFLLSFLLKDKRSQGEFIQASYRSSAALLGEALINNIYGSSVMGPLMIIGSVPLYNIIAVTVLSVFKPERGKLDSKLIKKTLKGIMTNPIILGIVAGLVWSLMKIPYPTILSKSVSYVSSLASPMGLMAMGASIHMKDAIGKIKPAFVAAFMKLFGFAAMFLPLAALFGFRNDAIVAILIMLGSATTVTSFTMAKNMGHDGVLSSNVVMLTTLLSGFSITFWLFILKTFQLI